MLLDVLDQTVVPRTTHLQWARRNQLHLDFRHQHTEGLGTAGAILRILRESRELSHCYSPEQAPGLQTCPIFVPDCISQHTITEQNIQQCTNLHKPQQTQTMPCDQMTDSARIGHRMQKSPEPHCHHAARQHGSTPQPSILVYAAEFEKSSKLKTFCKNNPKQNLPLTTTETPGKEAWWTLPKHARRNRVLASNPDLGSPPLSICPSVLPSQPASLFVGNALTQSDPESQPDIFS